MIWIGFSMCFSKKRIKTCIRKYQTRDICTLIPLLTWLYQIRFTEKDFFFKLQTSVCTVIFLVAIILQKLAILQTFWFLHSLQNFVFCDQSSFFGSCKITAPTSNSKFISCWIIVIIYTMKVLSSRHSLNIFSYKNIGLF